METIMNRRAWLVGAVATSALLLTNPPKARAAGEVLNVAHADDMGPVIDGPIKNAVAAKLGFAIQGPAESSSLLAQLIASHSMNPDVFICITASPMRILMKAGLISKAIPIARTSMVVAYNPKGPFGDRLAGSGKPGAEQWWQILESNGFRFGRTDPVTDPEGRNIIFVMQLAERYYRQPGLAQRILGPALNPKEIFDGTVLQPRLQSGELDAASGYRPEPSAIGLPYVKLPEQINLSNDALMSQYGHASVTVKGNTYRPEPLIYYAAVLKGARYPRQAQEFVTWLTQPDAQTIFKKGFYDPIGASAVLRA